MPDNLNTADTRKHRLSLIGRAIIRDHQFHGHFRQVSIDGLKTERRVPDLVVNRNDHRHAWLFRAHEAQVQRLQVYRRNHWARIKPVAFVGHRIYVVTGNLLGKLRLPGQQQKEISDPLK